MPTLEQQAQYDQLTVAALQLDAQGRGSEANALRQQASILAAQAGVSTGTPWYVWAIGAAIIGKLLRIF